MNGNETLIIVLSVIFLPIALIVLFKMPNDRKNGPISSNGNLKMSSKHQAKSSRP